MHSLDLLYEKETTAKLLEFKLKYLVSYATLMQNYFSHMNFADIVGELMSLDDPRAAKLMLIAAMVVGPKETVSIPLPLMVKLFTVLTKLIIVALL